MGLTDEAEIRRTVMFGVDGQGWGSCTSLTTTTECIRTKSAIAVVHACSTSSEYKVRIHYSGPQHTRDGEEPVRVVRVEVGVRLGKCRDRVVEVVLDSRSVNSFRL